MTCLIIYFIGTFPYACTYNVFIMLKVLERDLAIFGFFIALGRSTQSYLSANGFNVVGEPIEGFVRYRF